MTDNDETPQVEAATGKPAKKAKDKRKSKDKAKSKAKSKAKPARPAVERSVAPVIGFDFVGKVDSLRVKAGAGAGGVEFSLRGRHGKRRSFRFDTADDFALTEQTHFTGVAFHDGVAERDLAVTADRDQPVAAHTQDGGAVRIETFAHHFFLARGCERS